MYRYRLDNLSAWLTSSSRKPLVIRGARQVGKTWLARELARMHNLNLVEINFEKRPQLVELFSSNEPETILKNFHTSLNIRIEPQKSLLLLDEIQATPIILNKLRWFAEDLPNLPVIATGSLLDFVLEEHSFSMPVGRINYMHLEPMSFEEYLIADGKYHLVEYIKSFVWETDIPRIIHEQLSACFREYVIIGGLPAAIHSWTTQHSFEEVNQIQHELIATYRDDFSKYSKRLSTARLDETMLSVPKQLGARFIYTHVNPGATTVATKQALSLLNKAHVCHSVKHCNANGIPLGADTSSKQFKEIFIDTGLSTAALGLSLRDMQSSENLQFINKGALAEQVVGQLLRTVFPHYIEPELYYWSREEKGSAAEVDYIMQYGNQVIPIEVKAGKTGTLKSLHILMAMKNLKTAVRFNADLPSITNVNVVNSLGQNSQYALLSLPFYMLEQIHRLIDLER